MEGEQLSQVSPCLEKSRALASDATVLCSPVPTVLVDVQPSQTCGDFPFSSPVSSVFQ